MSTSPRPWVKLEETASDGRDAFIETSAQKRKDIKKLLPRPHYVLGRCHDKTGYFHIETWEAHFILYHRIKDRLSTMQQELAGACGIWVGPKQRKARTEEVDHVNRVREQLYWELFYPKIAGLNQIPVAPDVLLECAGGSCGGAMAFKSPAAARGGSKSDRSFVWGTGSVGGQIRGTRSAREESLLEKVFVPFVSVVVEVLLSDD